ncbi:hypothetical protein NONI108955_41385 [Nocardia ninae]|uniref:Uncharacterized protein n=1 Tax=Nocardia ninae NBRC 108245 TaxID=1210091 RepID=A0A511MFR6_9NOCA|nr:MULTISPECIES: hypothetical protein [Nocardia]GEM39525.1 hypothetical protein NN4_40440 [Nocardia ninae NBRC 108245]
MSKIRVFGVVFAATAGIILAGSGLASAGTDSGSGTGSAKTDTATESGSATILGDLLKLLSTGSAEAS